MTRQVGAKLDKLDDPMGGVFAPSPNTGVTRPVYSAGPKGGQQNLIVFTCPVSAIPMVVWDLLGLWWHCRLMRCLPHAGGLLDQPLMVRMAFPIFEGEYRVIEAEQGRTNAMVGAEAALAAMAAAMGK